MPLSAEPYESCCTLTVLNEAVHEFPSWSLNQLCLLRVSTPSMSSPVALWPLAWVEVSSHTRSSDLCGLLFMIISSMCRERCSVRLWAEGTIGCIVLLKAPMRMNPAAEMSARPPTCQAKMIGTNMQTFWVGSRHCAAMMTECYG